MKFDLLGGSYEQRFKASNAQRTINWYPVITGQTEQNKSQISLYPTPGLVSYTTLPGRYGRGLFTLRTHFYTKCFAIVDNTLYEIKPNFTYTTIGTLSAISVGSSRIKMECNLQNELFIPAYDASYVYDLDTSVLTKVTDSEFPNNVTGATYLDQYMIVCANGAVFESLTTSALNWDSTQTFSPTFKSAPVIAVAALREQIFNFTTETIEVYINDGESPYSRLPRTSVLMGIKAKDSLATFQKGFAFIGSSRVGEAQVYFYDGWNEPQAISDQSVAYQLSRASTLEDAYGYIQETKDGHYWYYLTVPSLNNTFIYDFNSHMWHWRQSVIPGTASDGTINHSIFRGAYHTNFNGKNLFLDAYSGKIFYEDYDTYTEDSNFIRRERISQEIWDEDKNVSQDKMIIDCNVGQATSSGQGSSPILQVSWSNDGGYTFTSPMNVSLGPQGTYNYRVRLNKLGTSRKRNYKLVLTDPVDLMLQGAYMNGISNTY